MSTLSQAEFEKIINRLQSQKTEPVEIDAKEDLPLENEGDKAFFIHHIAALANNVVPSFLIIGLEDKSWIVKGLNPGSFLLDPDEATNRMNQILEKRLDPQLAIHYRTYTYQGETLGLISVEGPRAPYLIAIDDDRFGGNRSRGAPFYIFRGAIYVRHGGSTIIANRQGRILEILKQSGETGSTGLNEFLVKNNYTDVDAQNYGRNLLTDRLVEITYSISPGPLYDSTEAKSWVSFVFSPIDNGCKIDTVSLVTNLQPHKHRGRDSQWFYDLPRPVYDMLTYAKGTPKSCSAIWFPGNQESLVHFTHAINISSNGHIHLVATEPLFLERQINSTSIRMFSFVNLVGYLWQLIYLAKAVFDDAHYQGNTMMLVNLVGSAGTFLVDLAKGPTKKWVSIGDWEYVPSLKDQARDNSIRVEKQVNLADLSDDQAESLIRDIARELGLYYGQQTPRCFTPDTNEFPVNYYVSSNS